MTFIDKPILYSMAISVAVNMLGYLYYRWKFRRGIMSAELCKWRYFLFTLFISCYAGLFMFRSLSRVMHEFVAQDRPNALIILVMHVALIIPLVWYSQRKLDK